MSEAHDLIMRLCAARKERDAAKADRAKVNENEWQRLWKQSRGKTGTVNGGPLVREGDQYRTPASKEAHRRYTKAAHKLAAATRAINKYGERHEA